MAPRGPRCMQILQYVGKRDWWLEHDIVDIDIIKFLSLHMYTAVPIPPIRIVLLPKFSDSHAISLLLSFPLQHAAQSFKLHHLHEGLIMIHY